MTNQRYDAVVVGAGAAGIGVGVALKHAGVHDFLIIERSAIGASFTRWPRGMRLITPSFPSNSIGMLDLNAIAIGTSPGYALEIEHPTGKAYAAYLQSVANYFDLPILCDTEVIAMEVADGGGVEASGEPADRFALQTTQGTIRARHVIWGAGEFQFPRIPSFHGAELGKHNSRIGDWHTYATEGSGPALIIGGYESGIDAAYQLARHQCPSIVLARQATWETDDSDPSRSLSPFTQRRLRFAQRYGWTELVADADVVSIGFHQGSYVATAADGREWNSMRPPILATGFHGGFASIVDRFALREDGFPQLNSLDESTQCANLFLVGPSVRHEGLIFCFIFKYRQRFAIVANSIAKRLGLETEEFESTYRRWGMFLDDLSCCGEQCAC
jgi:putative flavoprotein involved in K+ transport